MEKIAAFTLGCKVNFYETEAVLNKFAEKGFEVVNFEDFADIYLVNTCSVTNVSAKKSRQIVRRAKIKNPRAIVAVIGCHAQIAAEELRGLADIIIGTENKTDIVRLIEERLANFGEYCNVSDVSDLRTYEQMSVCAFGERHRAFVKVQDGCDMFCAYCVIPYARGRSRSRPLEDVRRELAILSQNGYKEVVLTGIHLASYGKDNGESLFDVIKIAQNIDGIERIRLSSIDPSFVDSGFVAALAECSKVCGHFHLSLQSGCDKTLKLMNRKYTAEQFAQSVYRLREAFEDVSITTDLIVGFPQENDEDFEESLSFAEKMEFMKIHVFPFSAKKGTRAANLDGQIAKSVKSLRTDKALALSGRLTAQFCRRFVAKTAKVLIENDGFGYTENYLPVYIENATGKIVTAQLIKYDENRQSLIGKEKTNES